ncbi:phosphotransferase enzyme family protein [Pseudobacter ginsenosidimutans]|uniref:Ser/Thr protein kinase RdoA (MazF antagonist) n=1 Tax=Pseudobacter ginsenosidimutans TaxID=661488 RepID=A0A4Q7N3G3_9BACT|nr:phosphotransferase [Pseudobacter ginsenosidimutans]QEC43969.1 phosphotransferase [Pseudobacter ginsenosidimutans]RZS75405.1 Ser/Thr protein kinase RdoA (MazF antagonist) [Pseudobacter ginsenosidimutans]
MTIFPTHYSTLSAPALGTFIEQRYGISAVQCRYKLRGVSDTYHVQSEAGEFILKIFRSKHRNQEELLGEIALLEYLTENEIQVASPVSDLSGNTLQSFQAIEGIRHGILYQFAPGSPIIEQNDEQIIQSAQYLARLHQKTEKLVLSYNRQAYTINTLLHEPLHAIRPAYAYFNLMDIYHQLETTAAKQLETLDKLNTSTFSTGYCHYDFMPKNWHHNQQGTITLFDFDFAGYGWLLNDIASYGIYLSLLSPHKDDAQRRLLLFIDAYTKIRALHPDELKALPQLGFLFILFYLKYQYENFEDHTNVYFGPRFLRERMKQIEYYLSFTEGLF